MKHRRLNAALMASMAVMLGGCSLSPATIADKVIHGGHESVAAATAAAQSALKPSVDKSALVEPGTLTVGIKNASQLPMSTESDGGRFQGLDIDLAADLADGLGLKVKYVAIDDPASSVGQDCDIVMDMADGESSGVTVVGAYAESGLALFGKKSDKLATGQDLAGTRVAVQMASTAQTLMGKMQPAVTLAYGTNLNECFHMLEGGEADYVACSAYQGAFLCRTSAKFSFLGSIGNLQTIGIGVSSSNKQLLDAVKKTLAETENDGTYGLIRSKWLDGMPPLSNATAVSGITLT